jgi:hypothetical protein
MHVTPILLFTLLSTACSSKSFDVMTGSSYDTGSEDGGVDATIDSGVQDTGLFVQPVWWRLSAGLLLQDGSPVPKDSTLLVELLTEDGESLCVQELTIEVVEPIEAPSELIMSWWGLTPTPLKQFCGVYDTPLPDSLRIGVGSMHPEILAAIGAISAIEDPTLLNAAYATISDDGPLLVYGVAGTPEAYEGLGEVVVEAPIPDGLWNLKPVYQFSF